MSDRVKSMCAICTVLLFILGITIVGNMYGNNTQVTILTEVSTEEKSLYELEELDSQMEGFLGEANQKITTNDALSLGYIGNLSIDDTDIDYPIMYSENPYYYTQHNSNNNVDTHGAIFIDYRVENFTDRVLLIHGLTPSDGSMFANLEQYLNEDWANEHSNLTLKIEENQYHYNLFCVLRANQDEPIVRLNCKNDVSFKALCDELIKNSIFKTEVNFRADKQLVILNTIVDDTHILVCFLED